MLKIILWLCCLLSLHAYECKELYVPAQEANLFCRIVGKGKPLIVIHGGPGLSQDYLLPQMYRLARHNQVVFYDQRGCGNSSGVINDDTITLKRFLEDLETIRKDLGFEKISILGHSWGGFLAMKYAITYPEQVEKLILSNTMPASKEDFVLFAHEYVKRTTPLREELDKISNMPGFKEGNPDLMEKFYRNIFRTYCYIPEKANLLNLRMTSTSWVNSVKVYESFRKNVFETTFNLIPSLQLLKVPTLLIHGSADPVPPITAEHVHEVIRHSEFVIMEKCGHFPYVEDPEIYFKHIEEFL